MGNIGIGVIVVLVIIAALLFHFRKKIKKVKLSNVFLVTGTVGSGKSSLSLSLVKSKYNWNVFCYYIGLPFQHFKKWFWKKFKHCDYEIDLKPMFYSNIPVNFPHNRLTIDILQRRVRIPLNSCVFIDESSLLADSMMYKSLYINDMLRNFFKLFRHYAGNNAYCVLNTQVYSDNHFSVKRTVGTFLFIHDRVKLPFITLCHVREFIALDGEGTNNNNFDDDVEESMKTLWFFNSIYKKYDSRCYSILTDKLAYQVDYKKSKGKFDLKCADVLDLHDLYNMCVEKECKRK